MNITKIKFKTFANGYSHFCAGCGIFFSAQLDADYALEVNCCSCCGDERLITDIEGLLDYCEHKNTDPVNFYKAFPRNELIPNSRTGATPRQVEWIVGCVKSDKGKKLPVTIESLGAQLGYYKEMVKKVFEELHITEDREEDL